MSNDSAPHNVRYGLSFYLKLAGISLYRTVLMSVFFVAGHIAYGFHWGYAAALLPVAFAVIVKFWSRPSHLLD